MTACEALSWSPEARKKHTSRRKNCARFSTARAVFLSLCWSDKVKNSWGVRSFFHSFFWKIFFLVKYSGVFFVVSELAAEKAQACDYLWIIPGKTNRDLDPLNRILIRPGRSSPSPTHHMWFQNWEWDGIPKSSDSNPHFFKHSLIKYTARDLYTI